MLTVHGDDNGVPNLRDEYFWFVFDLHVASGKNLGVDTFRKSRENVSPWRPNRDTQVKRTSDGKDAIPDNVPEIRIEEKEKSEKEEQS